MSIKKAVISTAGFGTRFLPISKTIQKEMMPILNRPVIDYVVEDCIKAGVKEIVIIMNAHNYQPLHYYRENRRLHKYLQEMGKIDLYEQVADLHEKAEFHFIKQQDNDPYGTSIPVKLAAGHIQNEDAFLYLTGDDFIYFSDPKRSLVRDLVQLYEQAEADAAITCLEKPQEEVHRYGVAQIEKNNGFNYLKHFVEKPEPGTAPSNLVNVSKYILTPAVLPLIENQKPDPQSGEFYITDIVLKQAQEGKVVVEKTEGEFLNAGSPSTWLEANLRIAADDENLSKELKKLTETLFN